MPHRKQRHRDALAALSVANLTFARTWNELLTYSKEQAFFFHALPTAKQAAAAGLNVLFLSILMYGVIRLMRKVSRKWGDRRALLLLPLLVAPAFNSISGILSVVAPAIAPQTWLPRLNTTSGPIVALVLASIIWAAWRWPDWCLKGLAWMTINFVLLVPVEFGVVVWHMVTDDAAAYRNWVPAGYLPKTADSPTVLWLIIDELDYRLLYEDRPAGLQLPEFDRLRAQALSASHAAPPANRTKVSVPSLLVGRRFVQTQSEGPAKFTGSPSDGRPAVPILASDTIFSSIRSKGINTSVIGWYLPYCRLFGSVVSSCRWYDMGTRLNVENDSFVHDLVNQAQAPYETATYSPFPQSVIGKHRIYNAGVVERDAHLVLSDPNPGFVYLHHMATHAPYVYDRNTKDFTRKNAPIRGYIDALAWADLILGTFRQDMEKAGTWDKALVLVTSDHSFRASRELDGKWDPRVPWIIKMPGQTQRLDYSAPMHTIVTRRFMEAVLEGQIRTQTEGEAWLRTNEAAVYQESEWGKPFVPSVARHVQ